MVTMHVMLLLPTDMLERGFEYAYKYGEPMNAVGKRYRVQPPCCKILLDGNSFRYRLLNRVLGVNKCGS
jgi:hypothetical protein